jgi:hypothetical protein
MEPNIDGWFGMLPPNLAQEFGLLTLRMFEVSKEIQEQSSSVVLDIELRKLTGSGNVSVAASIEFFRGNSAHSIKMGRLHLEQGQLLGRMAEIVATLDKPSA